MLWLIIVLIGLIAGLYYIYRTAVLKKGVRYFVSALIMRNNHWYEKKAENNLFLRDSDHRKHLQLSGKKGPNVPLLQRMMFCYMHGSLISVPKHG